MTASELRGAARAYKTAQDKRLKAILNAHREGMTLRAIALEIELTYGRVWQILNKENRGAARDCKTAQDKRLKAILNETLDKEQPPTREG